MSYPTGHVVKILRTEYDENPPKKWCLVVDIGDTVATLCTGETFYFGDIDADYEQKPYVNGRSITCPECKESIDKWRKLLNL